MRTRIYQCHLSVTACPVASGGELTEKKHWKNGKISLNCGLGDGTCKILGQASFVLSTSFSSAPEKSIFCPPERDAAVALCCRRATYSQYFAGFGRYLVPTFSLSFTAKIYISTCGHRCQRDFWYVLLLSKYLSPICQTRGHLRYTSVPTFTFSPPCSCFPPANPSNSSDPPSFAVSVRAEIDLLPPFDFLFFAPAHPSDVQT